MFSSEAEMKKVMVENLEHLKSEIVSIFGGDEDVQYLGDEIIVPTGKIDMLFSTTCFHKSCLKDGTQKVDSSVNFYVVELKNREGQPQDLAQIARYMNGLNLLLKNEEINSTFCEWDIYGILICTKQSKELQDLTISEVINEISVLEVKCNIELRNSLYSYTEKFTESITKNEMFYNLVKNHKDKILRSE